MAREVTTIPSTLDFYTKAPLMSTKKKRVAAYARVSTDNPEQLTSFETQKSYFEKYIRENPDWDIVSVYADEGISGTSLKKRVSFQEMVNGVRRGEIDIVLAKSVSRFARNLLDTISLTREFRALGVDVFFEEDNLHSIDPASEFILSIYASIAQEESRHISENVKWSLRHNFSQGKVTIPFGSFLGYKKGENGEIEIDEDQAKVVKLIYDLFLNEGMTPYMIAGELKKLRIKTVRNTDNWTYNSVLSILTNEKYKGEAILQKGFVADYLDHKVVKNEGQLAKYHVKNSHPAIIEPEFWDMAQLEVDRRNKLGRSYSSTDDFASKVICGDCGCIYGRKVWHSGTQYKTTIYQCNKKFTHHCKTPNLTEDVIKSKFVKAYNSLLNNKDKIAEDLNEVIELLTNTSQEEERLIELGIEMEAVEEANRKLIEEKKNSLELNKLEKRESAIRNKFNKVEKEISELKAIVELKNLKRSKMVTFVKTLESSEEGLIGWDKKVFLLTVETAKVEQNGTIRFKFYSGEDIIIE